MSLEKKLIKETKKWKKIIESKNLEEGETSSKNDEYIKNIKAYISDTNYFLEKEKYIKAFEAIIWAWAWYEIGKRENIIK